LFARKGFAGTSLREIGAALGIANASIIYHFPSKAKLYAAVLDRIADSAQAVLEGLDEDAGDAATQIRQTLDSFADWGEANPGYLRLVVRELMENPERLARARKLSLVGVVDAMRRPIDRARQEGLLPDIDPGLFLLHLIGSITYFTLAEPTVCRITNSADADGLRRRFRETLHQVLAACLVAGPSRSAQSGQEGG
jgi:AcrR family transcriptional regulator